MGVENEQVEALLRLWVRNQSDVYRYIFALLPNANDAQEVLQATHVALWRKADQVDLSRPFLPYAFRFALLEIRKFRDQNKRWASSIDIETLGALADEREKLQESLDHRRAALANCLTKLSVDDRELLRRHYDSGHTIPDIASATGRNVHTLYKTLQRIRRQLLDCVSLNAASGDVS
jgi:RNA polymerase sigma-70 factor, ECF subfamily